MNKALEDAVELALAVQDGGLTQDSLRAYEAKRIPRCQEIMAAEMVGCEIDGVKTYLFVYNVIFEVLVNCAVHLMLLSFCPSKRPLLCLSANCHMWRQSSTTPHV